MTDDGVLARRPGRRPVPERPGAEPPSRTGTRRDESGGASPGWRRVQDRILAQPGRVELTGGHECELAEPRPRPRPGHPGQDPEKAPNRLDRDDRGANFGLSAEVSNRDPDRAASVCDVCSGSERAIGRQEPTEQPNSSPQRRSSHAPHTKTTHTRARARRANQLDPPASTRRPSYPTPARYSPCAGAVGPGGRPRRASTAARTTTATARRLATCSIVPTSTRFMRRMNESASIQNSSTEAEPEPGAGRQNAANTSREKRCVVGLGRGEGGEVVRAHQQRRTLRKQPTDPRHRTSAAPAGPRARSERAAPAPGSSTHARWRRRRASNPGRGRAHDSTATSSGSSAFRPADPGHRPGVARDLTPGVHAGIGASGHGQRHRVTTQHDPQRVLERGLHRSGRPLGGPARKPGSVVLDQQARDHARPSRRGPNRRT